MGLSTSARRSQCFKSVIILSCAVRLHSGVHMFWFGFSSSPQHGTRHQCQRTCLSLQHATSRCTSSTLRRWSKPTAHALILPKSLRYGQIFHSFFISPFSLWVWPHLTLLVFLSTPKAACSFLNGRGHCISLYWCICVATAITATAAVTETKSLWSSQ